MGTIARFDLREMRDRYGVRHFVETGTGAGDGLAAAVAMGDGFRTFRSCEIDLPLAGEAKARFAGDPRVHVFAEESDSFLARMCRLIPGDEPILFWLDAHFPGADHGPRGYGAEQDATVRLPLERELAIVAKGRPWGRDVVVCDDLRIYVDGPFAHGNLPAALRPFCPAERGIGFARRLMSKTHDVQELYEHEGYLLMTPKGTDR